MYRDEAAAKNRPRLHSKGKIGRSWLVEREGPFLSRPAVLSACCLRQRVNRWKFIGTQFGSGPLDPELSFQVGISPTGRLKVTPVPGG